MKQLLHKRRRNLIFQEKFGKRNAAWRMYLAAMVALAFSLLSGFPPVQAKAVQDEPLCGDGFAPDYGLSYDLLQPHWTVGWEAYASEQAVNRVDRILDRLNDDAIAQTMILMLPQEQVGIRTNCAVHFLRYMKLGLPTGERKDNGFVFLIVVEPDDIDVHYAVGLGLPALTASELTNINRAVESKYRSTQSIDQALTTLAIEFNLVARNNYEPASSPASPEPIGQPTGPVAAVALCSQVCLGLFLFLFLIWMFTQMGGGGTRYFPPDYGPWGGSPWGGSPWRGGSYRGFPSRGFPSGGGRGFSGPRMRGGSGSGRSGRTN